MEGNFPKLVLLSSLFTISKICNPKDRRQEAHSNNYFPSYIFGIKFVSLNAIYCGLLKLIWWEKHLKNSKDLNAKRTVGPVGSVEDSELSIYVRRVACSTTLRQR